MAPQSEAAARMRGAEAPAHDSPASHVHVTQRLHGLATRQFLVGREP